jgi:hypothetical protein
MPIDRTHVVDFIVPNDRDGNTSLIISDHLPWDTDELHHWYLLQEKVNAYLPYILDGKMLKDFLTSKGRKTFIVITAKHPLNDASRNFVNILAEHTRKFGVELRYFQSLPGDDRAY